jgi:hypothetical protein
MKTILIYFLIGIIFYFIINNNKNGFSIGVPIINMRGGITFRSEQPNVHGLFNGPATVTMPDGTTIAGEFHNGQLTNGGTLNVPGGLAWMGTFPLAWDPATNEPEHGNHIPSTTPWRASNASGVLIEPSTGHQWEGTFDAEGNLINGTITLQFGGVIHVERGRLIRLSCGVPSHQSWLSRQGGDPGGGGAGTPGAGAPQWNPHAELRRH